MVYATGVERVLFYTLGIGSAASALTIAVWYGGMHIGICSTAKHKLSTFVLAVASISWVMRDSSGSSVPMPAMSSIASEMVAMDKRLFRNEATFQVTMYLARVMLAEKLITKKEYRAFEQEMLRKYQTFSGDLYTC